MINGEYGNTLRVSAQEDISSNTNTVELRSPSPYVTTKIITVADGLVVGTTNKNIDGVNYLTGEYVEYVFQEDDIIISGDWVACLISLTPSGENKILGSLIFPVTDC